MVGHIAPEAARGGPIALLHDGDRIFIDGDRRELRTDADLDSRRASWKAPAAKVTHGALAKYARLVGSASDGATTHPNTAVSPRPHAQHTTTKTTAGVTA
jgi:dihydroxy-acid dehydratase